MASLKHESQGKEIGKMGKYCLEYFRIQGECFNQSPTFTNLFPQIEEISSEITDVFPVRFWQEEDSGNTLYAVAIVKFCMHDLFSGL